MQKTILIVTDNLEDQINGVVTTYKNIEACAIRDDYRVVYITPREFRYFDCPGYHEVKIAIPWSMGKKIEALCPDYIHIATEGPIGLWARAYLSKRDYRYTTAYHTKFPEGLNKLFGIPEKYTWPLIRWFHKNSSRILTTTDSMVNQLHQNGFGDNVVSWTRGVDRKIFNSVDRIYQDFDVKVKSPVLLCVSRVSKEKNLEDFFNLEYPGATKIMVGDGPMRDEYESKYPDVKFVGYKTGRELAWFYANSDVFVFPSRWETFGIVMIESMACGTPVAAYPVQGPIDVVEQGITGALHSELRIAVDQALLLSRDVVHHGSLPWTWESAWEIFKDNLVKIK